MTQGYDKRRTLRIPIHFKVKVGTVRGTFNGIGRDLSEGGMGVYLPKLPPVGSAVDIEFDLPRAEVHVVATGEVTYHQRGGSGTDWVGIRFVRMDTGSHDRIRAFVRETSDPTRPVDTAPPPLPKK
jgi:c-di-GMP-binding flagellar brake protein YcgR